MTITWKNEGTADAPVWSMHSDKHLVQTGPIRGPVVLPDGTVVDVTADWVEVDSVEIAQQVAHAVGERYAAEGHPDHDEDTPFRHVPSEEKA